MRLDGQDLSFSPTDLASFAGCRDRTWLDRLRALGLAEPDVYPDLRFELLKERGLEHEAAYLTQLEAEGQRVVRFEGLAKEERHPDGYARRAEETLAAMRDGPDVIYQGTVYDGRWLGLVDFLIRVERPSQLGDWSYEVADAKLTREAKATAVLQTCVYSEILEHVQGAAPEKIHLYLGGPSPRLASFRLTHFAAYYRGLKRRFLAHVDSAPDEPYVAPDPVELCRMCDWASRCSQERTDVDHLALVADITRDQRRALEATGTTTLAGLAELALDPPPEGLRSGSFHRIREQARVQLEGRTRGAPYHEVRSLEENADGRLLGLGALPEPTPHDLFFDFEGADYAYDDGLEYLWGISDAEDQYVGHWALTKHAEKAELDRFLGMAIAHVADHPGAHIYHYGHYETTALKRLVGRYGIRTEELDQLLTMEVFVDLHRIVKQGVRASVEGYSIKHLEEHFGFERDVPMSDANPARARLEYALSAGLRDDESLSDRPVVEGYNKDDCVSTRVLRDWLESLRVELEQQRGEPIPRPTPPVPKDDPDLEEWQQELGDLMDGLLAGIPEERDERNEAQQIRWLTAHLMEWHRREDKTAWWDYFRLKAMPVDELVGETRPLAGLEYLGVVDTVKQSNIHRFRFPPQEHRFDSGDKGIDPVTEKRREVWATDELARTVDLKVGKGTPFDPEVLQALLTDDVVRTTGHRARLRTTAQLLLEGEPSLQEWSPASLALLRRDAPRFGSEAVTLPEVAPEGTLLERAKSAVLDLNDSVLPVQGPPGTGKTYSGARMIRALLRAGKRVGITGPSHKVITNLLTAVCEVDEDDAQTPIHCLQITKEEGCQDDRVEKVKGAGDVAKADAMRETDGLPPFNLVAGTSWVWVTEDHEASVDVLFIDEAGQFSLANALAVAPAAPKLVLLGDPQQLNQPQKGTHPPGTEVSVLEHLAGEDGILAPEHGLFLGETWRMRPEITAFTSELFYENKLTARGDLTVQRLALGGEDVAQGMGFVPVAHEGNSRESVEEAEAVTALFQSILIKGAEFTDRKGVTRPLVTGDLLVVAPYNAQASRIREALQAAGFADARVGTVDKFQGQEAPVAIYSPASSTAEDAPRGMDFLYALDRLNVATSRARVATFVVASPRLLEAECKKPAQMRMVNALVRYGEMSGGVS